MLELFSGENLMNMVVLSVIFLLIVAYLLGSIPNAVWIGKRYYGIDVREHGSKNAGATNTLRVLGRQAALPVFVLDALKGFVAVTLMSLMKYSPAVGDNWLTILKLLAVAAAVIGHIYPIFADFRGGKGVATLVGAVIGIVPSIILLCFGVWLVVFILFSYVSLASMCAGVSFPIFILISPKTNDNITLIVFAFIVALLLIWTHRKNISRLRAGTESKISIFPSNGHKPDVDITGSNFRGECEKDYPDAPSAKQNEESAAEPENSINKEEK